MIHNLAIPSYMDWHWIWLAVAAFLAGVLNAVAGAEVPFVSGAAGDEDSAGASQRYEYCGALAGAVDFDCGV